MKVTVINGDIAVDRTGYDKRDNNHWRFIHDTVGFGSREEYLRGLPKELLDDIAMMSASGYTAEDKLGWATYLIACANVYAIEIDQAARDRLSELKVQAKAEREVKEEMRKQKQAQQKWQFLKKHGCGQCPYRCRDGDDQVCALSGDLLIEKQEATFDNGIFYPFYVNAYPTENCKYNDKKVKENYKNECLSETS